MVTGQKLPRDGHTPAVVTVHVAEDTISVDPADAAVAPGLHPPPDQRRNLLTAESCPHCLEVVHEFTFLGGD